MNRKIKISRRQMITASVAGGVGLVCAYPFFIERYLVMENHYRIPVPNLPSAFEGFRIVQIADLHYGFLVPMSVVRRVVRRANKIPADLIVCTGDYIHEKNSTAQIDEVWPELDKLESPSGVMSILGNHDHWGDTDRSQYWLEKTGQNMRFQVKALEKNGQRLWFAGAGDYWEDHQPLDLLLKQVPADECRIVLAHNPDSADTAYDRHFDLMICGHTHGGQVKIPFLGAPVLPVENKNYSEGFLKTTRGMPLFISRGIGWAILPVRFNCFPEIAVLELVAQA